LPAGGGGYECGQLRWQGPLADQQQTNYHEQDGNTAFKTVIGDVRQADARRTMRPCEPMC